MCVCVCQGCLACIPCDGEVLAHDTMVCSVKCDTSHQPLGQIETHASIRTILSCITELGAQRFDALSPLHMLLVSCLAVSRYWERYSLQRCV